ncbi:uncharacterized protein FIBRA_01036 [Fibroporia radiculosa]|uniref:Uncharacterized protein n=1 Tax=Fibroporia radiculosa TaxID=599839 RepID=J4HSN2_9APHY|nr:uncharacterized protein FIBRA_01036 [Fibroporia radiculosa]CCL99027.1 predicted protein [Fibroporia radiculosa]
MRATVLAVAAAAAAAPVLVSAAPTPYYNDLYARGVDTDLDALARRMFSGALLGAQKGASRGARKVVVEQKKSQQAINSPANQPVRLPKYNPAIHGQQGQSSQGYGGSGYGKQGQSSQGYGGYGGSGYGKQGESNKGRGKREYDFDLFAREEGELALARRMLPGVQLGAPKGAGNDNENSEHDDDGGLQHHHGEDFEHQSEHMDHHLRELIARALFNELD